MFRSGRIKDINIFKGGVDVGINLKDYGIMSIVDKSKSGGVTFIQGSGAKSSSAYIKSLYSQTALSSRLITQNIKSGTTSLVSSGTGAGLVTGGTGAVLFPKIKADTKLYPSYRYDTKLDTKTFSIPRSQVWSDTKSKGKGKGVVSTRTQSMSINALRDKLDIATSQLTRQATKQGTKQKQKQLLAPAFATPTTPTPLPFQFGFKIPIIPIIPLPKLSFKEPKAGKEYTRKAKGYATSYTAIIKNLRGGRAKPISIRGEKFFTGFEIRPLSPKGEYIFETKIGKVKPVKKKKKKKSKKKK